MSEDLIGDLVEQVIDLMEILELPNAHIEGQSMGGWVATRLALAAPERVLSLVLTTPMGLHARGDEPDAARMRRVLDTQLSALAELDHASIRRRMSTLFADESCLDDEIVDLRCRIYADPETNAALRAVAERYFDVRAMEACRVGVEDLQRIEVPTLVYWGTRNPTPPNQGRRLAECIPGSQWHCAEAGHWAQYEKPEEHNRVVHQFITRSASVVSENGHFGPKVSDR